jgi:hypothetical protein
MANKGKSTKGARKEHAVAVIKGYTDSVIGSDAALIGLIVTLGFAALMIGVDPWAVIGFGLGAWVLWVVTKFANAYLEVRKQQLELDRTRVIRGQEILESHPDRQKRLFPPGEGAAAAGMAVGAVISAITYHTRTLRERAACLKVANRATNDFYDIAERLLADASVPDRLKHALYDLTLAVTDKEAGAIAFEAILEWMETADRASASTSGLGSVLDGLRKNRGDLYDDFHNALRAAIAALMFAYGPGHSKVDVEFEATRNQSIMLALMSRVDRVISEWVASGGRMQGARA